MSGNEIHEEWGRLQKDKSKDSLSTAKGLRDNGCRGRRIGEYNGGYMYMFYSNCFFSPQRNRKQEY